MRIQIARATLSEHPLEPLAHLRGGLVGERDREDLVRLDAMRPDQVGDPVREDAGLARARARDDEERPVDVEHCLALGRVEVGEELLVRSDGHGSMLAAASRRLSGRVRYQRTVSSTVVEKPERRTIRNVYVPGGSGSKDAWQ